MQRRPDAVRADAVPRSKAKPCQAKPSQPDAKLSYMEAEPNKEKPSQCRAEPSQANAELCWAEPNQAEPMQMPSQGKKSWADAEPRCLAGPSRAKPKPILSRAKLKSLVMLSRTEPSRPKLSWWQCPAKPRKAEPLLSQDAEPQSQAKPKPNIFIPHWILCS